MINKTVFKIIVIAALLVIIARVLAPFAVGKDQSSQLEAAQNLASGRGLTTTNDVPPTSLDIIDDAKPRYLTWWPPGFSLILAAFLITGMSLLASLKTIYALVTLVGWIGWGNLASRFITKPITYRGKTYPVHLVIAALLPIFFTLGWDGTDIFLWAGIPFLFLMLIKQRETDATYGPLVLGGLLFGALYSIRYSSLFLALAALLIILQVRFPDYRDALKRVAIFLLAGMVIVLPTYLYGKFYAVGVGSISDRATLTRLTSNIPTVLNGILTKLPLASNLILGNPVLDQVLLRLNIRPLSYLVGIICLTIVVLLPIVLIDSSRVMLQKFQRDIALSLWLLPVSLLIFLIGINLAVRLGLLGVRRYYEPLVLCGILIFYQLVTVRRTRQIIRRASMAIVFMFLAYVCLYLPALAVQRATRGGVIYRVLGYVPSKNIRYGGTSYELSYPSFTLHSPKEGSRQKVRQLAEADPEAMFFVEEYAYFTYDRFQNGGPILGNTMRIFPRIEYWKKAHTSGAVRVYWVVNEDTSLSFVPLANQRLIYSDPIEHTKIVFSSFPANYRFSEEPTSPLVAKYPN